MVQHARRCGLRIEVAGWSSFDWPRDRRVVIRESLTLGWTFLEYVPVYRLDLSSENPAFTRLWVFPSVNHFNDDMDALVGRTSEMGG